MFSKFSIGKIVRGQLDSMKSYQDKKTDCGEIFILFVIPLISPILQYGLNMRLNGDIVGLIVSAASIFAGLLLNLLVLLYSILNSNERATLEVARNSKGNYSLGVEDIKERELIEYTFYNISFSILISVMIVVSCLVVLTKFPILSRGAEIITYYAGFMLFIAVFQILKRFHSLLEHKIKSQYSKFEAAKIWGKPESPMKE